MSPTPTENTLPGHVGSLSASQTDPLKNYGLDFLKFLAKKAAGVAPTKKSGYFGFEKKVASE
ncbi:hypothetical protein CU098_012239 [Rhizopus stolonifer]|uniref:Uncharacterized protein n=1 Tax=Rhizopus stolonifer TaxID=4846 RepID=A0A367KQ65_RHIST|nr:hypothetical protein CU098_012239 [Rhizopus stolonifer]